MRSIFIAGGFLALSSIAPAFGANVIYRMLGAYFKNKRLERSRFLRDLRRLQDRNLIKFSQRIDGSVEMHFTKKGKKYTLVYKLDALILNKKQKWDGKWRLIIFDIPHNKKRASEALRCKLCELGFYHLQKSVFLTPYECEDVIDFVCSFFGVREHVLLFNVSDFEGAEKFRHHFCLREFKYRDRM